ncbi:MAG: hypothetical protein COV47_03225 [Candidatus Diapherotrites archaeon CG11_big_fil_rev_8_21_14_0_20_37_9]|nr:MAG: hypothetical protein COV47_03225 [Candidatus Diapherotrites archaeon CG11_big_fil_rev_8_21_14_0_20_37_9]
MNSKIKLFNHLTPNKKYMNIVPFILAGILSFIHYFSEELSKHVEKYHEAIVSFSAGMFITIIIISLLPEFFDGAKFIGQNIYPFLLLGFVFFHISEKYIYQHIKNKKKLMKDLAELHAIGFFVDHFVKGIALVFAFQGESVLFGFALFISFLLHTVSSSISLTHIDDYFKKVPGLGLLLAISPMIGVLFAELMKPDKIIFHSAFSFVIGALLYISIRDMLPEEKEGRIGYFLIGFATGLAIVYSINFLIA